METKESADPVLSVTHEIVIIKRYDGGKKIINPVPDPGCACNDYWARVGEEEGDLDDARARHKISRAESRFWTERF